MKLQVNDFVLYERETAHNDKKRFFTLVPAIVSKLHKDRVQIMIEKPDGEIIKKTVKRSNLRRVNAKKTQ